jgi:hypothetical protein
MGYTPRIPTVRKGHFMLVQRYQPAIFIPRPMIALPECASMIVCFIASNITQRIRQPIVSR